MAAIADAMRLIWNTNTIDQETAVWRMHCARKGGGLYSFVHGAMEDFYAALYAATDPIIAQSELVDTRIQEWDAVSGQFVQVSSSVAVALSVEVTCTPVQCAAVLTTLAEQPFGGRRQSYQNRSFIGPVAQSALGAAGLMESAERVQVLDAVEVLHSDLENIANFSGVTFEEGLCIVSEKLVSAFPIVEATMDNVVDTQRRRRRSLTGSKVSTIAF